MITTPRGVSFSSNNTNGRGHSRRRTNYHRSRCPPRGIEAGRSPQETGFVFTIYRKTSQTYDRQGCGANPLPAPMSQLPPLHYGQREETRQTSIYPPPALLLDLLQLQQKSLPHRQSLGITTLTGHSRPAALARSYIYTHRRLQPQIVRQQFECIEMSVTL